MIGGWFFENFEAVLSEYVQGNGFVGGNGLEEAEHFAAGVGEVGEGDVAGVDEEDGGVGADQMGRCSRR